MLISNLRKVSRGYGYLCLLLFTFSLTKSNAQLHNYARAKYIRSGINSFDYLLKSNQYKNILTFCTDKDFKSKQNSALFHQLNFKTGSISSFDVEIPESLLDNNLPEFSNTTKYLLIQDEQTMKLHRFIKNKRNEFLYGGPIKTPSKISIFSFEAIDENRFLLKDYYNHHPMDSTDNITLAIYNAKKDSIECIIHPKSTGIAFSHLQNHYITSGRNRIALADAGSNKIRIYDFKLKEIQILNLPDTIIADQIPFETNLALINPKILIEELKSYSNYVSRVESIYYDDNNLLYISIIPVGHFADERSIICYNERNNTFTKAQSINFREQFCDTIDFPIWCDYVPYSFKKNISIVTDDSFIPEGCLSKEEFTSKKNQYYEKNDAEYLFILYRKNQ